MNTAQIAHIFWKEYRTQRSIWLGILLIAVVIQALVWAMMPVNARDPLVTLASIGAILSVFYALASAGVLFAGEREEQTYSWLRILPVSNLSLFGGKFLWLAVSWLLAVGVSLLTAYLPYWGTALNSDNIMNGLTQFAVMGGGLALWGIFFSLLCQRVYSALALAPLALLLTAGLNSYFPGLASMLYAAVFIGTVVQGRRWIVEENLAMWTGVGWRSRALTLDDVLATSAEASPAWRFFRRELWLEWRNARWVATGSFALMAVTIFFLVGSDLPDASHISWILMFALLPLAFGVNTFRAEQYQARYRFHSHVGASPAAVWTAKHLVWGGLLALMVAPVLLFMIAVDRFDSLTGILPFPDNAWQEFLQERFSALWVPTVVLSLSMACWMYAVGHVCSLLIKRSVSAALVAIALGTLVCVPVAATFLLDVPRVIGMGLPAGSLLAFSLWRTKDWLSERNETRDWVRVFGVMITLGLVCLTSWVMWRLSELTLPPIFAGLVSFFPIVGFLQLSVFGGSLLLLMLLISLVRYRRKVTFRRLFVGWSAIHILSGVAFVAAFDAEVNPPSNEEIADVVPPQEAFETGNQYRDMNLLISEDMPISKEEDKETGEVWRELFSGQRKISAEQLRWLEENDEALGRLIEITKRQWCAPDDLFDSKGESERKGLSIVSGRSEALLRLSALRHEQAGDMEQALDDHLALQRFYRHYAQFQTPFARHWTIRHHSEYLRDDLNRWINHPDQTPELLIRAASEFSQVEKFFYRLDDSFERQAIQRQWAIAGNYLGSWVSKNPEITDWPVFLDQALHRLPWEKQRAMFMLETVMEHQMGVAAGIRDGNVSLYGPELAGYAHYRYPGVRPAWEAYAHNNWRTRETDHLWKLVETTPIIQATNQQSIDGYDGYGPERSHHILVNELTWIQYRRLALLQMAFRAAELQTGEKVNSLEKLVELKSDPVVDSILEAGESMEGSYSRLSGYNEEYEKWKSMLYYDPISGHLIEMSTINMFRNPPTD